MNHMFTECQNLESVNLTSFDTSNVVDMTYMFYYCRKLTTLDLSTFDTSSLNVTRGMFSRTLRLNTIYVSESWDTRSASDSVNMFWASGMLVGGNGTVYDENYVDKTYACIDTPTRKGYFTAKAD